MAPKATAVTPTRSILGSLTTTWTAPSSCNSLSFVSQGDLRRAQFCARKGSADDVDCWPPRAVEKPPPGTLNGWGAYSPGIQCPAGQTTACVGTPRPLKAYPTAGGMLDDWVFQFPLKKGEKGAGCCPSGYDCSRNNGAAQMCHRSVQTDETATITAKRCSASPTVIAYPDTQAQPVDLYAPMFQLIWRDEDLQAMNDSRTSSKEHDPQQPKGDDDNGTRLKDNERHTQNDRARSRSGDRHISYDSRRFTSSRAAEGMRSSDLTPTPTAAKATSSPDSGPDTSTIAAGALGGLVGFAVVLVVFLLLLRRARRRKEANEKSEADDTNSDGTKPESECSSSVHRVEADGGVVGRELEGSWHHVKELDAQQGVTMELEGDKPVYSKKDELGSCNTSKFQLTSHKGPGSGYSVFPGY
ncbi:MAG: hypothetical protein M1831_005132 [Alyxoria varia]|nr:MAG: hypothetical protein M1831_005132 [Alyxoria varia]